MLNEQPHLLENVEKIAAPAALVNLRDLALLLPNLVVRASDADSHVGASTTTAIANELMAGVELPKISGRVEIIDGSQGVVGVIVVNGQILETALLEGSFNKNKGEQAAYAKRLGYRLATREENNAYVESLLIKEVAGAINQAETLALDESYRKRFVRDLSGGLDVGDRYICAFDSRFYSGAYPDDGALFVRALAASK